MLSNEQALSNLAANLSAALARRDWDQIDLAKEIVTPDRKLSAAKMLISRCAGGRHNPGPAALANIAEALDVSVDWLLSTPRKKAARHAG